MLHPFLVGCTIIALAVADDEALDDGNIGYNRALNHIRDTARFTDLEALAERPGPSNPRDYAEYTLMLEKLYGFVAHDTPFELTVTI